MICDCCLMPTRRPEWGVRGRLVFYCVDCWSTAADARVALADLADFVALCWSVDVRAAL